jgi:hypothetical protein
MSKDKVKAVPVATPVEVDVPAPPVEVAPPPTPRLSDVDRMALELAKSKRQTALAEAKTALANNDNAELSYKYVVLQLYMKYGLTERDALGENGDIIIGGAVPKGQ